MESWIDLFSAEEEVAERNLIPQLTNLRYVPELVEDVDGEANDLFVQNLHVG